VNLKVWAKDGVLLIGERIIGVLVPLDGGELPGDDMGPEKIQEGFTLAISVPNFFVIVAEYAIGVVAILGFDRTAVVICDRNGRSRCSPEPCGRSKIVFHLWRVARFGVVRWEWQEVEGEQRDWIFLRRERGGEVFRIYLPS